MAESLFTPINDGTEELEHYGVKGMKWGQRKAKTYKTAKLDFSKSAAVYKKGESRIRPLDEKVTSNAQKRLKGDDKKRAKLDAKRLELVAKEENYKYNKAWKQDRKDNRAKLKQIYKENGGDKRTVGQRVVETVLSQGGMLTGYKEARLYGANKNAALVTALITGPMAGVAYREARLIGEPMKRKYQ